MENWSRQIDSPVRVARLRPAIGPRPEAVTLAGRSSTRRSSKAKSSEWRIEATTDALESVALASAGVEWLGQGSSRREQLDDHNRT